MPSDIVSPHQTKGVRSTMASYAIGTLPPVGEVPPTMFAHVIRSNRLGEPKDAFKVEEVPTPTPKRGEVLIAVMAAGINYNNVWAARGIPIDVIAARQKGGEPEDFHVGGSDASGIVYAVGEGVTKVKVGDEVAIHHGWWDADDPWVLAGKDPMIARSSKTWGYQTNYGSFGQFSIVQEHQCLPKAPSLSWEEAAASTLCGTTAYRMMFGWAPHDTKKGDVVLVWGGSGGVGSMAIQLAKAVGAIPVAVVSDDERGEFCIKLGAKGYINRNEFSHWGTPPHWTDEAGQKAWTAGARAFGAKIWEIVGEKKDPAIVIEHPGEATVPTSIFVCEPGGMVVICAGTTGYSAVVDLRYHWTRQKRFQGSHGTNDEQAIAFNKMLTSGAIHPALGEVLGFEEIPHAHQRMHEGDLALGNTAILIGAASKGLGKK